MQEMFNKDLEDIKNSQSIMNNAINEIKSHLEGTNCRITESKDRISEVEDRMVGKSEAERRKEKRIKRNEDNLRDLWDNVKRPNIQIIGVPEEDKKKGHEKTLEEIIVEHFLIWEENSHPRPRNPESLKQDKLKVKHPKTHINQSNEDQTQRANIKSSKGKITNNTQGDLHKDNG